MMLSVDWVIVVNDNDEEVGTMLRDEAHQNGTPHRIVVTYVANDLGQIVVQVRKNGSLDHSSAGHVDPGESYANAAARELAEELGIVDVDLKRVDHGSSHEEHDGGVTRHEFDIFVCNANYRELQADEVLDAYWADPEEI